MPDQIVLRDQKGIALVLSLFLMAAMSVITASLMLLSQTETNSSMNYRLMSQARYGAESGVQSAMHFLLYDYTAPGNNPGDPLASYNMTGSPVTWNGQPVVLSGNPDVPSNYPISSVQTAFAAAVQGSLANGRTTVAYTPYARLMSMQQVNIYGGGAQTIQTWQIVADGTINAGRTAQVEVSALLDTRKVPAQMYAAFATGGDCGALSLSGGTITNSYNSRALSAGHPVIQNSGGNVGTNGNLDASGNTTVVNGSLSTPRVGVGRCSSGNVDAMTSAGGATVTGGIVNLPDGLVLADPAAPNPPPPTTSVTINGTACGALSGCTTASNGVLFSPGSYGNVTVAGGTTLHLVAGTYNFNAITLSGNSLLVIDSGPVVVNVSGQSQNTPVDLTGGTVVNATYDPSLLQMRYGGTGTLKLAGGSTTALMVYAPDASLVLTGGSDFYGSIVAKYVNDTGGTALHYDTALSQSFYTVGNPMLSSFSWKAY